ncbi:hypothetical protein DPMN_110584 [Dreissena polymorpha]|uniref:Uncharacterized protein n=1 Tax=Dreissena polymorpha TaxID=45954 RepID=A0A9D4KCY0_DREPO|nr:hypothetical protein DPMN_110584 [Dreissena polymorpha]
MTCYCKIGEKNQVTPGMKMLYELLVEMDVPSKLTIVVLNRKVRQLKASKLIQIILTLEGTGHIPCMESDTFVLRLDGSPPKATSQLSQKCGFVRIL